RGCVHRHTRADDDQILPSKGPLAVSARFHRYAMVEQHENFFAELVFILGIGNGDLRALRFQKQRRSYTRFAQADDQHAFVAEIHELKIPRRRGGAEKFKIQEDCLVPANCQTAKCQLLIAKCRIAGVLRCAQDDKVSEASGKSCSLKRCSPWLSVSVVS